MTFPHQVGRTRVLCTLAILAVAMVLGGTLAPIPALAQPPDPTAVAITLDDLPSGFSIDEERTELSDSGPIVLYSVFYQRDVREVVLGTGPFIVANLVAVSQIGPVPGLLDGMMEGIVSGQTGEPLDGPSVGEDTRWYVVSADADGLPYDMYVVGFSQGDAVAMVLTGGFQGRSTVDDGATLADLVSTRLAGE
jgi:hypothetical protein